jgi:hypothetical protein
VTDNDKLNPFLAREHIKDSMRFYAILSSVIAIPIILTF